MSSDLTQDGKGRNQVILTIGCDACGKVIPNEETYVCGIVGNRFAHYHDTPECHPESYRSLDRVTESVTSGDNNCHTHETAENKPIPSDS